MSNLVLSVGCRRGVELDAFKRALGRFLRENDLGEEEIGLIASCDLKSDEKGLLELAHRLGVPTVFFSRSELDRVAVPNPSVIVKSKIGTFSVAEAAAILAGTGKLLVPKHKYGNITFALGNCSAKTKSGFGGGFSPLLR